MTAPDALTPDALLAAVRQAHAYASGERADGSVMISPGAVATRLDIPRIAADQILGVLAIVRQIGGGRAGDGLSMYAAGALARHTPPADRRPWESVGERELWVGLTRAGPVALERMASRFDVPGLPCDRAWMALRLALLVPAGLVRVGSGRRWVVQPAGVRYARRVLAGAPADADVWRLLAVLAHPHHDGGPRPVPLVDLRRRLRMRTRNPGRSDGWVKRAVANRAIVVQDGQILPAAGLTRAA